MSRTIKHFSISSSQDKPFSFLVDKINDEVRLLEENGAIIEDIIFIYPDHEAHEKYTTATVYYSGYHKEEYSMSIEEIRSSPRATLRDAYSVALQEVTSWINAHEDVDVYDVKLEQLHDTDGDYFVLIKIYFAID